LHDDQLNLPEKGHGRGERTPEIVRAHLSLHFIFDADPGMKPSHRQKEAAAEPCEMNLVLAEVDRLIAAAEERIEQQRRYVRTVAAERKIKAMVKLEAMQSALAKLKRYRAHVLEAEARGQR
jgi:hypothetical protein